MQGEEPVKHTEKSSIIHTFEQAPSQQTPISKLQLPQNPSDPIPSEVVASPLLSGNNPVRKDSLVSQSGENEQLATRRREDAKSIFLENVDYKSTREQLQEIFEDCGLIIRITILKDNFTKKPKGCAYVSFAEQQSVELALALSGMRLRGRAIKVQKKRTNIAGMSKSGLGDRKYLIMAEMVKQFAPMQRGRCRRRGADGDV